MRFNYFVLSFFAMSVAALLLVGCKDDDIAGSEPENPTQSVGGDYNPDLDGIWLETSSGSLGQWENPVEIEHAGFFIIEPENHISALYYNSVNLYGEFNIYADADSMVIIDPRLLKDVEAALEGKKIDYMNLPIPDGYSRIYAKQRYELVNKDSLVFLWENMNETWYAGYTRLKEVEKKVEEITNTRFFDQDLVTKVTTTVDWIRLSLKKLEIPDGPQDHDAIYKTMDELNANRTGNWSYENWMEGLPGSLPITDICIPGAHDACTGGVGKTAIAMNADCQSKSLSEQLLAGVRYFDIRTRWNAESDLIYNEDEKNLYTFHGIFSCNSRFEDVILTMKDFLNSHKNEFVILRVSYESDNTAIYEAENKAKSVALYHKVENKYKEDIMPYYPGDTLGSVRGKILIINDQEVADMTQKIGSYTRSRGDNEAKTEVQLYRYRNDKDEAGNSIIVKDSTYIWEQNYYTIGYKTDRERIDLKEKSIYNFAYTAAQRSKTPVFITQLNANTGNLYLNCCVYAEMFNRYAFLMFWDNLNGPYLTLKGGIYSMDYAGDRTYIKYNIFSADEKIYVYGDRLVWAIIERNYRSLK